MNKRLMSLVAMMAVTGSILAAPVALASDTTQTQATNTIQQQTQVQVQPEEETPVQTARTQQFRFRSQQTDETGPNYADKDGNQICDNFNEEFLPERRMAGPVRNGDGPNFEDKDADGVCDNDCEEIQARDRDQDGDGDKVQLRQSKPASKPAVKPAAPQRKTDGTGKTGDGGENYVDADKDGECDNLGTGGIPEPKLDGSGNDGEGRNYDDSDHDGVCDNLGDGPDQVRDRDQDGTGDQVRQGARKGK